MLFAALGIGDICVRPARCCLGACGCVCCVWPRRPFDEYFSRSVEVATTSTRLAGLPSLQGCLPCRVGTFVKTTLQPSPSADFLQPVLHGAMARPAPMRSGAAAMEDLMRSKRNLQRVLGRRASVTELMEHFQNHGLTPLAASLDKTGGALWAQLYYSSEPESVDVVHTRYRRMHENWHMQQMRSVQGLCAPAGQQKRAQRPCSAQPFQPDPSAGTIDRSSSPPFPALLVHMRGLNHQQIVGQHQRHRHRSVHLLHADKAQPTREVPMTLQAGRGRSYTVLSIGTV